jgi:hypothetical protein
LTPASNGEGCSWCRATGQSAPFVTTARTFLLWQQAGHFYLVATARGILPAASGSAVHRQGNAANPAIWSGHPMISRRRHKDVIVHSAFVVFFDFLPSLLHNFDTYPRCALQQPVNLGINFRKCVHLRERLNRYAL